MIEKEIEERKYTYEELRNTFLAGSRMASEHHVSWREAFEKWIKHLQKNRKNAMDLS